MRHLLFSSDGACLYAASSDGALLLLDVLSSFQPFGLLPPNQVLSESTGPTLAWPSTSSFCGSDSGQWVALLSGSSIALLERPFSNNSGGGGALPSGGGAPGLTLYIKLNVSGECLSGAFTSDSRHLLVVTPTKVLCFHLARASLSEPKPQRCAPFRTLCRLPSPATNAAFLSDPSDCSQWPSLVVATSQGLQVCPLDVEESSHNNNTKSSVLSSAPLVTVHLCAANGCVAAVDDEGSVFVWAQQQRPQKQSRLPPTAAEDVVSTAEVSSSPPFSDDADQLSSPSPPDLSPPPLPPTLESFPTPPPAPPAADDATSIEALTQRMAQLRPAIEEVEETMIVPLNDGRSCGGQPLNCARVLGFGNPTCGKVADHANLPMGQQHLAWVPDQGVVVYACGRHLIGWQAGQQSVVAGAHADSITAVLTLRIGSGSEKKKTRNGSGAALSPKRKGGKTGSGEDEQRGLLVLSGSNPSLSSQNNASQYPSYEEDRSACLRVWRFEPSSSGPGSDDDDDDDDHSFLGEGGDDAGAWVAVASLHQHDEAGVACLCAFGNGDEGWWISAGGFDAALDGCLVALWSSDLRAAASTLLPRAVLAIVALPPHPHRVSSSSSPAGLRFATADEGGGVALWAVTKNSEMKVQRPVPLANLHATCLVHVPLSPLGSSGNIATSDALLACGTSEGQVHMWSFKEGGFTDPPLTVNNSGDSGGGGDSGDASTAVKGLIAAGHGRLIAVSSAGALVGWEAVNSGSQDDDDRGNGNNSYRSGSNHWQSLPGLPPLAQVQCSGAIACDTEGDTLVCGGEGGVWLVQNATSTRAIAAYSGNHVNPEEKDDDDDDEKVLRLAGGNCGSVNLSWVLQGERLLLCGDSSSGALRLEDTFLGRPVLQLQTATPFACLATAVTTTSASTSTSSSTMNEKGHADKDDVNNGASSNGGDGGGGILWAAASYADGTVRTRNCIFTYSQIYHLSSFDLSSLVKSCSSLLIISS